MDPNIKLVFCLGRENTKKEMQYSDQFYNLNSLQKFFMIIKIYWSLCFVFPVVTPKFTYVMVMKRNMLI